MVDFTLELEIPPGIYPDNTSFSSKGRWADCSGVRFFEGKPQAVAGSTIAKGSITGSAFQTFGFCAERLIFGMQTKLLSTANPVTAPTDITPASPGASTGGWSIANFGTTLLAARWGGPLFESANATVTATAVSNAPASIGTMVVTPWRQVVVGNTNEVVSGALNPRCIRCSTLEDYSSAGSWTPSSTNNADEIILDDPGGITRLMMLGQYVLVWTGANLYLGQYIGDPGQSYRFDRVDGGVGLLSGKLAAQHAGFVYWIGLDQNFYKWQPGGIVELIPCSVRRDLDAYGAVSGGTLFVVPRYNELWLSFRDTRDVGTTYSRYVAVNLTDGSWSRGAMTAEAVISDPAISLLLGGYDSGAFLVGSGTNLMVQGTGEPISTWSIQSADQYLNSGKRRAMIKGVVPDFKEQTQSVDLTVYVRDRPQSTAVTKGPYALSTSATKKDFRVSGLLMSVKFSGTGSWRMGKPTFDIVPVGER